mgnify:FL=1
MTANNVYLSPLQLANAFTGTNQSLGTSGWQKLPGGLIMQWGNTVAIPASSMLDVLLPTPFNTAYAVIASVDSVSTARTAPIGAGFLNLSTIRIANSDTQNAVVRYLAIGA